MERVTARAKKQCLVSRRLRSVRPEQMRQLYNATATLGMDYCTSDWFGPSRWVTISLLRDMDRLQRVRAQAVALVRRTISLQAIQAEATLLLTAERLAKKNASFVVRGLALLRTNPAHDCNL